MNSSNETKHCTKCNAILNKNAAFCTECGEKYIEQSQNDEHTENAADQPKVSESNSKQSNTQKDKLAFKDIIALIPIFIGIAMISYGWFGFERADEDYYSLGDIAKAIYISTGFLIVCLNFLFINLNDILNTENNKSNMKENSKQKN